MSSLQTAIGGLNAFCNFDADVSAPAFRAQNGFNAALTRTSAGLYVLTLQRPMAVASCVLFASLNGTSGAISAVYTLSNDIGTITVTTMSQTIASPVVGAAADIDFSLIVLEAPPNNP